MMWQLARAILGQQEWKGKTLWVKAERPTTYPKGALLGNVATGSLCTDKPAFETNLSAPMFKSIRARADYLELLPVFAEFVPCVAVSEWQKMTADEVLALRTSVEKANAES